MSLRSIFMKFQIEEATKSQSKLRCAIYGPSGAGKTFTALAIAHGMSDRILLIDTEHKSASKYANRKEEPIFKFQTIDLRVPTIDNYIATIKMATQAKYSVLIIDSLSHAWQAILDEVAVLTKSKFKGNSWSAWSEGTPMQKRLIEAILDFDGHIICTIRAKTDWLTEQGNSGKTKPVRVGLAPEQGKGIEYEFDLLMEISVDHVGEVIKDRTGRFQDKLFTKLGIAFGKELIDWLNEGTPIQTPISAPVIKATADQVSLLKELANELMIPQLSILKGCEMKGCASLEEMSYADLDHWIAALKGRKEKKLPPTIASSERMDTQLSQQEI